MHKLTYFDLERTLINAPTNVHYAEALAACPSVRSQRGELLSEVEAMRLEGDPLSYVQAVDHALVYLRGAAQPEDREAAAVQTAERWWTNLFKDMRTKLEEASESGPIVIISDGTHKAVSAFGEIVTRKLGGQVTILATGLGIGDYQTSHKQPKLQRLWDLARVKGIYPGTNAQVFKAYGDSRDDAQILSIAEHPTVVNPLDDRMRRLGERPGWETLTTPELLEWGDLTGSMLPSSPPEPVAT